MAQKQGITHVKFTNKKGVELPNVDWITGVDCDAACENRNNQIENDNEEEDNDPTYIEQRV